MEFLDQLKAWGPFVLLIMNGFFLWIAWSFRQATVSRSDFEEFTKALSSSINDLDSDVRDRLTEQDKRISTVEAVVKGQPGHDDLKDIYTRMNGMSRTLSKVEGATSAMANQTGVIYQHLLSQKGDTK